jgi:hypothetical protein
VSEFLISKKTNPGELLFIKNTRNINDKTGGIIVWFGSQFDVQ